MSAPARAPLSANDATLTLWRIAATENVEALEDVLVQGADINASDVDGMTALMRAAEFGKPRMARALIERGANLDAVRADGFTPLLLAAFFGHSEVVKLLVESGADVSCTTRFDTSAEMWANARTFYGVVRYLREARAKATIANANPQSEELLLPSEEERSDVEETLEDSVTSPVVAEEAYLQATPVIASPLLKPELVANDSCEQVVETECVEGNESLRLEDLAEIQPARLVDSLAPEPVSTRLQNPKPQIRTLSDPPEIWELVPVTSAANRRPKKALVPSEDVNALETLEDSLTSADVEEQADIRATPVIASPLLEPELVTNDLCESECVELNEIPILEEPPKIQPIRLVGSSTREPVVTRPQTAMPQIRTLSDPPEIWDLVHETPAQFSAGSAFLTRLTTGAGPVVLGLLLLLFAGLGTFWFLKSRREPGIPVPQKQTQASVDHKPAPPSTSSVPSTSQAASASAPVTPEVDAQSQASATITDSINIQPFYRRSGIRNRARKSLDPGAAGAASTDVAPNPGSDSEGVAKNDSTRSRSANVPNSDQGVAPKKSSTPTLSPQMIAPNTPTAAPKGKVIQWP